MFIGDGEFETDQEALERELEGDEQEGKLWCKVRLQVEPPEGSTEGSKEGEVGEEGGVEITLTMSFEKEYPESLPCVSLECPSWSRGSAEEASAALASHLEGFRGEQCSLEAISWVKEEALRLVPEKSCEVMISSSPSLSFLREWLHFHHLYSQKKRKIILDWSRELSLTGFSYPGKPGIVCVEGEGANVSEFVRKLRGLTWKKMSSKLQEEEDASSLSQVDSFRSFCSFSEISSQRSESSVAGHSSIGWLCSYLREKDVKLEDKFRQFVVPKT